MANVARSAALRVEAKAENADALAATVRLVEIDTPKAPEGSAVVEIRSSGVNPSDVKAVLGAMPHAVWPRTPGRDYAGVVVDGPRRLIGKEVWGSGGELGVRRDGAHATHLVVAAADLREKPAAITLAEAGAVGVPFVTAYTGLTEAGAVKPTDVVLVLGANGKVGQATIQLATAAGARVFGVQRTSAPYRGHANGEVTMLGASEGDIAERVREATGGHGADIVFNTVGSPYFEAANRAMAMRGRQIFISTIERAVPFDIFAFYRGQHRYIGIDTLALNSADGAAVLESLRPNFDAGKLRPFPVLPANVYPLARAAEAYKAVISGALERVVLDPTA
ncbi:MAG: zinc-binding alcohol dehydrogenase family protein [Hyphomicrobiales bacterium]|nr:zinc-binding alcohol dehydrogenase family protein [Hyphomicrobiales bacterium]